MVFDVIIPAYRPAEELDKILKSLVRQVAAPRHILLMVTKPAGENVDALCARLKGAHESIRVHVVEQADYDHAATRNLGVSLMEDGADAFLMMTQDAVPHDDHLTERLKEALEQDANGKKCAATYARQLTGLDASVPEKCARRFNYPAEKQIKTIDDLDTLGIKTFFCSNVCAMYRLEIFREIGGFEAPAIFNEDMVYAAAALRKGYAIVYQADAQVTHAHAYGLKMQFKRSFDNGASQAIRADVFAGVKTEAEGTRYVKETVRTLNRVRQPGKIPYFILQCAFRYLGFWCGKHYRMFPRGMRRALSMNRNYWTEN